MIIGAIRQVFLWLLLAAVIFLGVLEVRLSHGTPPPPPSQADES